MLHPDHPLWKQTESLSSRFFTAMPGQDCIDRATHVAKGLSELYPNRSFDLIAGRRVLRYGAHDGALAINAPEVVDEGNGDWKWHCWIASDDIWIDPQTGAGLQHMLRSMDREAGVDTMPDRWPFAECMIVEARAGTKPNLEALLESDQPGWWYQPNALATQEALAA